MRFMYQGTDKILKTAIFVLDHRGTRVSARAGDNKLPQFMEIRRRYGLRERQFTRENRWYSDFVWFDVDVGGYDRPSGVVDTFALAYY